MSSKQKSIAKAKTHECQRKKASLPTKSKRSSKKCDLVEVEVELVTENARINKLAFFRKIYYAVNARFRDGELIIVLEVIKDSDQQYVPLVMVGDKMPYLSIDIAEQVNSNRIIHAVDMTEQYIYLKRITLGDGQDVLQFYDLGLFVIKKDYMVDDFWDFRISSSVFEEKFSANYEGTISKNGLPNLIFSNQEGLFYPEEYEANPHSNLIVRLESKRDPKSK